MQSAATVSISPLCPMQRMQALARAPPAALARSPANPSGAAARPASPAKNPLTALSMPITFIPSGESAIGRSRTPEQGPSTIYEAAEGAVVSPPGAIAVHLGGDKSTQTSHPLTSSSGLVTSIPSGEVAINHLKVPERGPSGTFKAAEGAVVSPPGAIAVHPGGDISTQTLHPLTSLSELVTSIPSGGSYSISW